MKKIDRNKYLNLSQLKERGWTDSKIKEWLKEPDEYAKNPMYRSASPTKLYLIERVIKQEQNEIFIEWFKNSKEKRIKLSQKQKAIHNANIMIYGNQEEDMKNLYILMNVVKNF